MLKNMKKPLIISILFVSLLITGCGKVTLMDRPAEDGNYYYKNKILDFSLVLPPEFIYYQAQMTDARIFVDLDFFVPTNDTEYPQIVPSYANPVKIRVFRINSWQAYLEQNNDLSVYQKIGEKKDWVYTIKFWDSVPSDWNDRWSDTMAEAIKNSFKL